MSSLHTLLRPLAAIGLAALILAAPAAAQAPALEYVPEVGQDGKDVVWVPSQQPIVERMLDMAKVTPGDYLIDLGSGDGRTVIAAARRGAKSLGIEYNPKMVELSKRNAARAGVADKASFVQADIFASDFSQASVLTLFLLPEINLSLRPLILNMKPGTRVVSNTFDMGNWPADETSQVLEDCANYCQPLLWIVPARVEGKWQLDGGVLELEQTHQLLSGRLRSGNVVAPVKGRMRGAEIAFTAGDTEYAGTVTDEAMEGVSKTRGTQATWRASRAK
jgi:SAM-dependent methyltransferase